MNSAVHLGENYNDNLVTYENTNFEAIKTLFDITQNLIFKPEARNQARLHDCLAIYFLDEIYFATWQSNQFVESNTSGGPPRDAAKIVRTTIHRVFVGVLRIKFHLVWMVCVGPEQDPKRLRWVSL